MKSTLILLCSLIMSAAVCAQATKQPVPVIFDSDMGPDYDDVGAIAMLHGYADSNYIKILATVASTRYEGVAAVFDVFNTYFKRPDILIGVPGAHALDLRDGQRWSDSVRANYPHSLQHNSEAENAVTLYRRVLAAQPDNSVVIITVGFLTNLADLLKSPADKYSPLNGLALVKQKVKQLVSMAGRFPKGGEFNVHRDAASSKVVFEQWPGEILLSGFEIGARIKVGVPLMHNDQIQNSPVKDVFRICIPKDKQDSAGRMSWDQTAVMVAVKGYTPWYSIARTKVIIAPDGANSIDNSGSQHAYLVEKLPPTVVRDYIEKAIAHQPRK